MAADSETKVPCPHCGGEVGEVNGGEGYWYPRRDCVSCGKDTTTSRCPKCGFDYSHDEFVKLAHEAWHRGEQPEPRERIRKALLATKAR